MTDQIKIDMGLGDGEEIPVYPQRHARLTNKLKRLIQGLTVEWAGLSDKDAAEKLSTEDQYKLLWKLVEENAYELLDIVLPTYTKRVPKYKFLGYRSQEALDKGDYDEAEDYSPTLPQIKNAFIVTSKVNDFDTVKVIGKIFDWELVKTLANRELGNWILTQLPSSRVPGDGAEESTTSGTSSPTWDTEGSVSPGSDSEVS